MVKGRWISKVVILGGGTAGWMTAAALSHTFGRAVEIVLVESDAIGTVGVGEATIPPIRMFHQMIGVNEAEFMRATGATFKLGIEFRGWLKEGSKYFHPFGSYGVERDIGYFFQYWLRLKDKGQVPDFSEFSLCTLAARSNVFAPPSEQPGDPLQHLQSAYHFDAGRYAKYLKGLCLERGVSHKIGDMLTAERDAENGHVTSLKLKSGELLSGDLFIDCSGMRAMLIGQELGVEYEDWSRWLPMNRACAVPCELKSALTPYTISTARPFGWQWRIPLQHRVGNGVVYSSEFGTDEAAERCLLDGLEGTPLAPVNRLKFTAGRRRTPWHKNVVSIGLASGFLEPLESTSIHLIQSSIQRLIRYFPDAGFSPLCAQAFNKDAMREIEDVRDFLILHYHATEREDSELWRYVKAMRIPDSLRERIELFRERGQLNLAAEELFPSTSWHAVLLGQGIRPRTYMPTMALQDDAVLAAAYSKLERNFKQIVSRLSDHAAYIKENKLTSEMETRL
ncbi:tryptophan 7-halogenase [Duganella sp. BJB488]|uniref:tryptophan halogenase family protein n=1 Tax=unclassified Duganella TaxID=2636909 RepID=UPI000E345B78|nr:MULTISPECIES: tryptophan halogenase family protein [unclassified Duganella]NVD69078.1 tryptophan 7-halogenase [Duganella sp. BJB1802]RFP16784.1 tryptophan 7-halogenase [Duganella sp. BJB489]RFP20794.1 tryptophan 7-halogenase [Duganella sp. BJB488]RFP32146.1 tryptophan 7-halogenase [Duganella sp. BJB480]